jgi:hypothetical protein
LIKHGGLVKASFEEAPKEIYEAGEGGVYGAEKGSGGKVQRTNFKTSRIRVEKQRWGPIPTVLLPCELPARRAGKAERNEASAWRKNRLGD